MLLSNEDIERLKRKGYPETSFVKFDQQGYATLQNVNGNCFFFNPEKTMCRERTNRPLGCRIYPVMLDEDRGIVVDNICPSANTFTEEQKTKRGKQVVRLLAIIDAEADNRRHRKS